MEDFVQLKIMSKRNEDGFDGGTEFGWAGHWRLDSDFKRWEFSQCEKTKYSLSFVKLWSSEHSVENREILSHWKKCREINSLVTSLVKVLLSRILPKKRERK